jgi:hypothetical protein
MISTPSSRYHFTLAVDRPDDGRWPVGEDGRHRRQVADVTIDDAEQRGDCRLIGGDRIEIAHSPYL